MSVDNDWVEKDKGASFKTNVTNFKIIFTVIIVLSGGLITVAVHNVGTSAALYQAEGILMDFGGYDIYWTDTDFKEQTDDPLGLLDIASSKVGFTIGPLVEGKLTSITKQDKSTRVYTTYENNEDCSWGLWYIKKGSMDFVCSDSYDICASDYTVTVWAYTKNGEKPTVAVDATGVCIYGYSMPKSMVTLSPVSTEIVGAMRASSLVVGTDMYSNYPDSISEGKRNGTIKTVGTYTDPSYEAIMSLSPGMVVCDGSQLSHKDMAVSLRSSSVNAVVLYNGEDIKTILQNVYIVGAAMGYGSRAAIVINELTEAMGVIKSKLTASGNTVMVALGGNPSPYVAGSNTYISSILNEIGVENVFSDVDGWPQVVSERISQRNPSYAVVLDYGLYSASEYKLFYDSLSGEWRSTDAYKNDHIYLLCEKLGDMSERAGPRFMQLFEILARILDPSAFDDGKELPLAIGDDYQSYLTTTKDLGYNI